MCSLKSDSQTKESSESLSEEEIKSSAVIFLHPCGLLDEKDIALKPLNDIEELELAMEDNDDYNESELSFAFNSSFSIETNRRSHIIRF